MPKLEFLAFLVLGLQMASLAIIVGAVVFYFRNRVAGDRRERQAVWAGLAVALTGAASVCLRTTLPFADLGAMMQFNADILAALCAGALVWMSCHGGILLGDRQGGYWVKQGSHPRAAALACLLGAGLSLGFSMPFFVAMDGQLAAGEVPSTVLGYGAFLCKKLAHSFGEEVIFRGWALAALGTASGRIRFSPWSANLLIAAIFAVGHTSSFYQVLTAFWAGLIMGVIFQRHGLIAAATTHMLLNLAVLLFPLLP